MTHNLSLRFNAITKLVRLSEYNQIFLAECERTRVDAQIAKRMLCITGGALTHLIKAEEDPALGGRILRYNGDGSYGLWTTGPAEDRLNADNLYVTGRTLRALSPHLHDRAHEDGKIAMFGLSEQFLYYHATAFRSAMPHQDDKSLTERLRPAAIGTCLKK